MRAQPWHAKQAHLRHAERLLPLVSARLRLDPRHLERVIPARKHAADNTREHLLTLGELGRRVRVQGSLELVAHSFGEALARRPVGHLPQRNRGSSRVEALRLPAHTFHGHLQRRDLIGNKQLQLSLTTKGFDRKQAIATVGPLFTVFAVLSVCGLEPKQQQAAKSLHYASLRYSLLCRRVVNAMCERRRIDGLCSR